MGIQKPPRRSHMGPPRCPKAHQVMAPERGRGQSREEDVGGCYIVAENAVFMQM